MKNIIYFIKNLWWSIEEYFINKWRINPVIAEKNIINYMLRKYNVDFDYVVSNPEIGGVPWYQYYTFDSEKEYEKWKKYALKQFNRAYPYSSENFNKRRVVWLDFQYGLKKSYENRLNAVDDL